MQVADVGLSMQASVLATAMGMASAFKKVFVNVQKDTLALTALQVTLYVLEELSIYFPFHFIYLFINKNPAANCFRKIFPGKEFPENISV